MSKVSFAIIPCILIILLSVFFYFSPKFMASQAAGGDAAMKEVLIKRFVNVGNLIAHATFVEDAIIMEEVGNLNEIITRFKRDEAELTYIHFTDTKNKVIASSDQKMIDKVLSEGWNDIELEIPSILRERLVINFISPTWSPHDATKSSDTRILGLAVKEISLV